MVYCNMCKNTRPKSKVQKNICKGCNKKLYYLPTQTKMITIEKWGMMSIVQYKPEIEG